MESPGRRFWEASLQGAATGRRRCVFPTNLLGIPWAAAELYHCWDPLAHFMGYSSHLWHIRNQICPLPSGRGRSTQAASQVPALVLRAQLGRGLALSSELFQIHPCCHREFRIGKTQGKKRSSKNLCVIVFHDW